MDDLRSLPTPQALWEKLNRNWLAGYSDGKRAVDKARCNRDWFDDVEARRCQLQQHYQSVGAAVSPGHRPLLLIAEPNPLDCLASFWAALLADWNVAFANPSWGDRERAAAYRILQPNLIWPAEVACEGNLSSASASSVASSGSSRMTSLSRPLNAILIPTGGTSGRIKFAHHTWTTLLTAASSFCQTFSWPAHTYCVLPVYHVSGLMQVLRAWLSQAQVAIAPFKTLETQPALVENPAGWYISLVPTQLARLLTAGKGFWLSQFRAVLLGGAPPWPDILIQAAQQKIPVCLSYGMTETAAMVAVQRPKTAAFSAKHPSSGSALPHAKISIEVAGKAQPDNTLGQIVVRSRSVACGYYSGRRDRDCNRDSDRPHSQDFLDQTFYTDDLGYLASEGQLYVTGRISNKIISGGENIFPAEVEAALRSTGQVKDICVFGQPDSQWGEIVVAAFVPTDSSVTAASLQSALSCGEDTPLLSRYKHPKRWIRLSTIPRNAQGKLMKSALAAQIR